MRDRQPGKTVLGRIARDSAQGTQLIHDGIEPLILCRTAGHSLPVSIRVCRAAGITPLAADHTRGNA